jgi:hypothetical protein
MRKDHEMTEADIKEDDEIMQAQLQMDNLERLSTDTQTFRVALLSGQIRMEQRVSKLEHRITRMGCIADPEVVRKHEGVLNALGTEISSLKSQVALSTQKHDIEQTNIMNAIGELKTGKKDNTKAIDDVADDVLVMQTEKKTMFMMIGIFVSNFFAIAGLAVAIYAIIKPSDVKTDYPRPVNPHATIQKSQGTP